MQWIPFDADQRPAAVAALNRVLHAGGPPSVSAVQLRDAVASLLLHADDDPENAPALGAAQIAEAITDVTQRTQLAELVILLPFADVGISAEAVAEVDELCRALDTHPAEQQRLHAVAGHHMARAKAHLFRRLGDRYLGGKRPGEAVAWLRQATEEYTGDEEIASRWQALGDLPRGTLGWSFFHFYRNRGFPLPGEHGAAPAAMGLHIHDSSHLIGGYDTDPSGEIDVTGFQCGYLQRDAWLIGGIALLDFQSGVAYDFSPRSKSFHARTGNLDPRTFIDAIARGNSIGVDLWDESQWDFWQEVERPLTEIRAGFGLEDCADVVEPQHDVIADARADTGTTAAPDDSRP